MFENFANSAQNYAHYFTAVNRTCSSFWKLTDFSRVHICVLAPTITELAKQSRNAGTTGLLAVFVLPGGKLLACSLSLSYTLETLAIAHGLEAVATPKCRHAYA